MTFKARVLIALKWSIIGRISTQVVSWAVSILVMRALMPSDYGLVAMASIFTGLFGLVAEIGMGSSLVQAKDVTSQQLREVFGLVLLSNFIVFLILAMLIAPLASFIFNEPQVTGILRIVALQFIPAAFSVLPTALLERSMQYKGRAAADFVANIGGALLTLWMAYHGYGALSLAWGAVLTALIRTLLLNCLMPFKQLPVLRLRGNGTMIHFGKNVAANQLAYYFLAQVDSLIVGKVLGQTQLGFYSVAMNLASMPASRVGAILNQVAFPAMSMVKREGGDVTRYFLRGIRSVSFVAFPVMWGMSALTPELIYGLLGPTWTNAVLPMMLLCLIMPLRMLGPVINATLQSVGRADISLRNTCTTAVVMCAAFFVGCQFGLRGLALAWVIIFPLVFMFNVSLASRHLNLAIADFAWSLTRPVTVTAIMYGVIVASRNCFTLPPLSMLAVLALIGACTYFLASVILNRAGVAELLAIIRPSAA